MTELRRACKEKVVICEHKEGSRLVHEKYAITSECNLR